MMKAIAEADEKKRKRMIPGSAGNGSTSSAPPNYLLAFLSHRIIYNHTDANCSLHLGVFQGIKSTGSSNSIISIE
jgi:hypothetical protein